MVFANSLLTIIEYGKNEILSEIRTEIMNTHLISIRMNNNLKKIVIY